MKSFSAWSSPCAAVGALLIAFFAFSPLVAHADEIYPDNCTPHKGESKTIQISDAQNNVHIQKYMDDCETMTMLNAGKYRSLWDGVCSVINDVLSKVIPVPYDSIPYAGKIVCSMTALEQSVKNLDYDITNGKHCGVMLEFGGNFTPGVAYIMGKLRLGWVKYLTARITPQQICNSNSNKSLKDNDTTSIAYSLPLPADMAVYYVPDDGSCSTVDDDGNCQIADSSNTDYQTASNSSFDNSPDNSSSIYADTGDIIDPSIS